MVGFGHIIMIEMTEFAEEFYYTPKYVIHKLRNNSFNYRKVEEV